MNDEVLLTVENLSKKFCRDLKKSLWYGVQDIAGELFARNGTSDLRSDEFWALEDVSFELRRGESLGLIGRNGAGKSTLLKLLNGLIKPDAGRIVVKGKVGALIELNAGFNPILTGRENIYVSASIRGVSKREVDQIVDEIVEFSGIEEFIDTPVQYYSSGMKVRLGFAIATSVLQPDVLLLDEVLAVGDAGFRNKCYNRIGKLRDKAAVIFVSHSMTHVAQVCDRSLYLEEGHVAYSGDVLSGIQKYLEAIEGGDEDDEAFEKVEDPVKSVKFEWSKLEVDYGETIEVVVSLELNKGILGAIVRIPIYDMQGTVVAEWNSKKLGRKVDLNRGKNQLRIKLGPLYLRTGKYKIAFVLNDSGGIALPVWSFKRYILKVVGKHVGSAAYQLPNIPTV